MNKNNVLISLSESDKTKFGKQEFAHHFAELRRVREHMQRLDEKRQILSAQVMEESDQQKRNRLESELRALESALTS